MIHSNRNSTDLAIIRLNSVGLSLGRIARQLGIHHTTVTHRLKEFGIPPANTRRAFMEEIFDQLSNQQQVWLLDQLGSGISIKAFLSSLIVKEFVFKKK